MIDKETILSIARDSGFPFNKYGLLQADEEREIDADAMFERFAAALLAHRAESGVEVPEPVYRHYGKGLNPVIGFDLKQLLNYGNARAAEALERAIQKLNGNTYNLTKQECIDEIRSLTP